ncbi:CPNA2-like protein [Mya arenaria]|uniref:CPNA2-like protein n=1 Tax=Mya arenaria TaxID=6604 RepID=A0ABY7EXF1_MYAAR|nr:CPNA2-like protein [Mya arenaria]
MEAISLIIFGVILIMVYFLWGRGSSTGNSGTKQAGQRLYPDLSKQKGCSIFRMYGEGIDFTASNIHQGLKTFGGRSLHHLDMLNPNPYEKVISILGETLEPFDDDGLIPAFGFGDVSTKDRSVFPFLSEAYRGVASRVRLSGPTNFAPLIYRAIDIVRETRSYHILVIVADGQVTSEQATRAAIVEASKWPLSIILVGVGDGPWEQMEEFDDSIPARKFDNFQFVDFHRIMSVAKNPTAAFALSALMEVPDHVDVNVSASAKNSVDGMQPRPYSTIHVPAVHSTAAASHS